MAKKIKTMPFDAAEYLDDPASQAELLADALETGDSAYIRHAIGVVAALGGDPNSAASMESFRTLANKSVMDGLNGSLGTGVSNADRSFIEKQVAGLDNTPEGNLKILELKDKVDQRKLEVANLARDYIRRNGRLDDGFDQEIADWAEKNKMFEGGETLSQRPTSGPFVQEHSTPAGQQSTDTAVRVQSVEEAQKLPAGTRFIDPNGIERVR